MPLSNYPAGAEYDSRAPWNQCDPEEAVRDIKYSCTLMRTAPVSTTDYTPGHIEWDEDGCFREDDDFSDTDWMSDFTDQYRTPAQLISLLKDIARDFAEGRTPQKRKSTWEHIADDCEDWEIDDEYIEET